MGTRMVSAAESPVHNNWKQAIIEARETDTLFLNQRHSPALRALRTEKTEALVDVEHNVFGDFGNALDLYFGGDMNAAIALSGQVAGRIESVESVADIVAETVRGFAAVKRVMLRRAAKRHLLIDSEKFGRKGLARVGALGELESVVVDRRPTGDLLSALDGADIKILVAEKHGTHSSPGR